MVSKQWMNIGDNVYTVENSNLYVNLPISFNTSKYIVEVTDVADACATFGASVISKNKIQVFNTGFNNGVIMKFNTPDFGGHLLALGL